MLLFISCAVKTINTKPLMISGYIFDADDEEKPIEDVTVLIDGDGWE